MAKIFKEVVEVETEFIDFEFSCKGKVEVVNYEKVYCEVIECRNDSVKRMINFHIKGINPGYFVNAVCKKHLNKLGELKND